MQFLRGSRDYCQGVQVHLPENSSDNVVFFAFLALSLFYSFTEGVQWLFQRKLLFLKVSVRVQLFQGERATFSMGGGGVQWVISIETHITCDFPGGGGRRTPYPPLDPHMRFYNLFFLFQKETLAVASQKIPLKKAIHLSTKTHCWTYK